MKCEFIIVSELPGAKPYNRHAATRNLVTALAPGWAIQRLGSKTDPSGCLNDYYLL